MRRTLMLALVIISTFAALFFLVSLFSFSPVSAVALNQNTASIENPIHPDPVVGVTESGLSSEPATKEFASSASLEVVAPDANRVQRASPLLPEQIPLPDYPLPWRPRPSADARQWLDHDAGIDHLIEPASVDYGVMPTAFSEAHSARARLSPSLGIMTPLALCLETERVWGQAAAGQIVTVTVNGGQMGAALADDNGFFWTTLYDGNGDRPGLSSGDSVEIYYDGTMAASLTLRDVTGQIDVLSDTVSGQIGGSGFPINVTVYVAFGEPSATAYSRTVTTDSSGLFSADFAGLWDFSATNGAQVAYTESGVEVHQLVFPASSFLVRPWPWNYFMGYATPGAPMTATLLASDITTIKESSAITANVDTGWYLWRPSSVDVLNGDVAMVQVAGGLIMSRTVDPLSVSLDADNDRVTGGSQPGVSVTATVDILTPVGRRSMQAGAIADASGLYTIEFGSMADTMPGTWAHVVVPDSEGDDLDWWAPAPSVEVDQTWNSISGRAPSPPLNLSMGQPVTLTIFSTVSGTISYSKGLGGWGWYSFDQDEHGLPDIGPGDVVTVETAGYGWQGVVNVQSMSAGYDGSANRFYGNVVSPTDRVEVSGFQRNGRLYPLSGFFDTLVSASPGGAFSATIPGFEVHKMAGYEVKHRTAGDYSESIGGRVDGLVVYPLDNGVWGYLNPPDVPYTMTLRDNMGTPKVQFTGTSSYPVGNTGWQGFWWSGERMQPGDSLQVQSAAGFSQTIPLPAVQIVPDPVNDSFFGTGPANSLLFVSVGGQGEGYVPTDGNGDFAVNVDQLQNFFGDGDLKWDDYFEVCHANADYNFVCWQQTWPQIVASYSMDGESSVWGNTGALNDAIAITVTHPVSGPIASGTTSPGACEGCSFNDYNLNFSPNTITPGNVVTADFGNDLVDFVVVLPVSAEVDPDTDVVTVTAPISSPVYLNAESPSGWWESNWSYWDAVVGASGSVTFDLSVDGFDVVPGTNFNIHINQRHGHQTHYSFYLPAPDVWVAKGTTSGVAQPGNTYLYQFNYGNQGNGLAENAVITDSLPAGLSYVTDTSGFPVVQAGAILTWTLGDLSPGDGGEFYAAFSVSSGVPTQTNIADNCAWISTTSPGDTDPGNNGACSGQAWVDQGDVGLWVDKRPEPNDPNPGQEFLYVIEYGSDGSAAIGPAWLTDTLPLSTTVVGWEENWGWDALWTDVITGGGRFALYAPAGIPGDMGGQIRLRLLLDANVPVGTRLQNSVYVTTANDVDPGNNWDTDNSAQVSGARYDLSLDKSIHQYVPTPGGWINYFFNYQNVGNVATRIWITETVPPGLSYVSANWGGGQPQENDPFPDPTIIGDKLVWDLGVAPVAYNAWFHVQMNISPTITPGALITNCATAGSMNADDTPADNTSCFPVTINPAGPNLRVDKWLNWESDDQLSYYLRFENIGDQTANDVWVTDTLPVSTTWDGWWDLQNFDWGRIANEVQTSDALGWQFSELYPGERGDLAFSVSLVDPNDRPRWYTNTATIDIPPGDINPADNIDKVVTVKGEVDRVEIWLPNYGNSNMWGEAQPGTTVTVTTPYTQVTGWADPVCAGCWNIDDVGPVNPGDLITVTAGRGLLPVRIQVPDPFTVEVDSVADIVFGQISGWIDREVEVQGNWPDGYRNVNSDGSGNFLAAFTDVPRGGDGQASISTVVDYAWVVIHRAFQSRDLILNVNYGHDWVNGSYETGHTMWITVTESDRVTIKASAAITTWNIPWWGGAPGFQTQSDDWLPGPGVDLVPGDWVFASLDNGFTSTVRIGDITGTVDVNADAITGTVNATWFTQLLNANCGVWEENGPGQNFMVDPQGGMYSCDFGSMGWDLLPGHDVGVQYQEPDGDWVINVFEEPIPNLHVNKWGQGEPGEGGNFVFNVEYWNDGRADAFNVIITDTMLGGLTYISDTLGLPHMGSGSGPLTWNLGDVPVGDRRQFEVFVQVSAAAGSPITNSVDITSSIPFDEGDPGELHADWFGTVQANDTHLNVGKWAWTGDPAAGYDLIWSVGVCNNGNTGSAAVIVTDTIPLSTTLVSWWGEQPGWSEVNQSGSELVLSYPSVPSWECRNTNLRFTVDPAAWTGMRITNTAVITAANDLESTDNYVENWVEVGDPHTNLNVDKWWNWGALVPGGRLSYGIGYGNNGNVPVGAFRITDTLPVSTTFQSAWTYDQYGEYPLIPVYTGTQQVVFEFPGLDNGFWDDIEIRVDVDAKASVGTVLTNTAEISPQPGEDQYDDNIDTWVETLFDHGPNIRVRKEGSWDDWGPNTRRASYNLAIENIGDVIIRNVTISDTYPANVYLDGEVGANYWDWWNWQDDPGGHFFTATFAYLNPANSINLNFSTLTDTEPLPFGLVFTNTAEVMLPPGDTNPADNQDTFILTTGPDLYVEKRFAAGELKPGALVTFSLSFGENHQGHEWWWNPQGEIWITDTLPAGLEFVSATSPSCDWCILTPDNVVGSSYAWNVGGIGSGHRDEIQVTVRITDSAQARDTFTNQVVIVSTEPISDVEPLYTNNQDQIDLLIAIPEFEVGKAYQSNLVAGTIVTYTLIVTNSGNATGTNVVLSDTLPTGVFFGGSDGTYNGAGAVTWNLDVPANGGVVSGWFTGTLSCSAGLSIVNDAYRVVSSDQGVSTLDGPAVSFTTTAPALQAGFNASPSSALVGTSFFFTDTSSTNGVAITSWDWDFGDGSPHGSAPNASHVYTNDGTFTVTLTVTDGCSFTDNYAVQVTIIKPNLAADFIQSSSTITVGHSLYFTDTSTTDGPAISVWEWDFGDGSAPLFGQNVSHTYGAEGTYTVTLTITDTLGYSATHVAPSSVKVIPDTFWINLPAIFKP